ncbi:MAG: hypothetical protein IT371_08600 [Deltaproteobacteria bacterium]|nr:hypothetical protein [Deltaproteobacteria bacterium]
MIVLAAGLFGSAPARAEKTWAYQKFAPGKSTGRAFASLTRRYEPVDALYREKIQAAGIRSRIGSGGLAAFVGSIGAFYIGLGAHGVATALPVLRETIARGNPGEIGWAVVGTALPAVFAGLNVLWTGLMARGALEEFGKARSDTIKARRQTVQSVLDRPELQRQLNHGAALPQADQAALRALANSLR